MMKRREFIKAGCLLCVAGPAAVAMLESCHSLPVYNAAVKNKKIEIPLSQFNVENYIIVRPANINYDIAVVKNDPENYSSYKMVCTHQDNPLRFNGNEFTCNLHGSRFGRHGQVTTGPAERSLKSFTTQIENQSLIINLI